MPLPSAGCEVPQPVSSAACATTVIGPRRRACALLPGQLAGWPARIHRRFCGGHLADHRESLGALPDLPSCRHIGDLSLRFALQLPHQHVGEPQSLALRQLHRDLVVEHVLVQSAWSLPNSGSPKLASRMLFSSILVNRLSNWRAASRSGRTSASRHCACRELSEVVAFGAREAP